MFILTDEPAGGLRKEAFHALDEAFGTGEFSQGQAITVLANADLGSAARAESLFRELVNGNFVTETED